MDVKCANVVMLDFCSWRSWDVLSLNEARMIPVTMTDDTIQISTKESTTMESTARMEVVLTDRMIPVDTPANTFHTCKFSKCVATQVIIKHTML